jgi:hypothetical protein
MSRISLPRLDRVESTEAHDQAMDDLVAAFVANRNQQAADDQAAAPESD